MENFFMITFAILVVLAISDLIMAIRDRMYQKRWDIEKDRIIRDDPDITAAELCAEYVDFCAQHKCLVEY